MTTAVDPSTGQDQLNQVQRRYFRIQEQQGSEAPPQTSMQNQQDPEAYYQPRLHPRIYQQHNYMLHLSQKYNGLIKIFCITSIIQDSIFFILLLFFFNIKLYNLFLIMMVTFLIQVVICIGLLVMAKETIDIAIIKQEYSTAKMIIYFVAILSLGSTIACIALYEQNNLQVIAVWALIIIGLIYMIPKLIALCMISCQKPPDDILLHQQN